jgi:hypothetical protein
MEIEWNLRVFNDFLRRIDLINLITVKNSNKKYKKSLNTEYTTKKQTFPKKSMKNRGKWRCDNGRDNTVYSRNKFLKNILINLLIL